MTRLEDPPPTTSTRHGGPASADASPLPSNLYPLSSPRPSRFARYYVRAGWLHLSLITGALIFTIPFLWMIATSLRTDEELTDPNWLPEIPTFRATSPYVRRPPTLVQPVGIPTPAWKGSLPALLDLARQKSLPQAAKEPDVDPETYATSAAADLVNSFAPSIPRETWDKGTPAIVAAFEKLLTPVRIADALDDRLARLELRGLQVRTWDEHILNLAQGENLAKSFTVESGPATLAPGNNCVRIKYDFTRDTSPIVLRYDFQLPCAVKDLHKLLISTKLDNSWHYEDATLDVDGHHFNSAQLNYLGQNRPASWIYQPESADDQSYKKRLWVTFVESKDEGRRMKDEPNASSASSSSSVSLHPSSFPRASLRLTLHPASTPRAIWGKIQWNYRRAFDAVPFWTYTANSLILVALTALGTLFSSTFVAYAFARLHWPGRSLAFLLLLSTMMLPSQVTMIPSFMIWRELGWYNTLNPLWVPAWAGVAFFIFLMTQHMKTIPRDLEEAARIDGLNAVQTWYYIILPLVKPAAAAVAIMTVMGAWNEFMGPLVYLRDQGKFPLSLGIFGIRADMGPSGGGIDWTLLMASNVLMTLPMILLFLLFQRYFVKGMTMSGMKG